jgi:hypothetical protein
MLKGRGTWKNFRNREHHGKGGRRFFYPQDAGLGRIFEIENKASERGRKFFSKADYGPKTLSKQRPSLENRDMGL